MTKTIRTCVFAFICLLQANLTLHAGQQAPAAQPVHDEPAATESAAEEEAPSGQVEIDGRAILTVYEPVASLTVEARAQGIASRIIAIARDTNIPPEAVRLQPREAWTEILAANSVIMAVTDADARSAGLTRQELAENDARNISQAIRTYREEHSWRMIVRAIVKTAVLTLVLFVLLWLVRRLRLFVRGRIEKQVAASTAADTKSAWQASVAYLGPMVLAAGTFFRWVVILALLEAYVTVTLGFYSSTRAISLSATNWVLSQLELLASSALYYVPNLLVLAVIILLTYYVLRLVKLIFTQIRKGDITIHGFYPDWAEPTDKLIRLMVLVLALVVVFPYLPGAKSPAFQGISIFVGVLLSLGSSSAVANAIAGIILTYMRSFLVGDWIQIGDTMGEVVERTLLVTRLLTPKAEIVTIPNSTVMNGAVKNYSTEARNAGVIFYTTVSIGFDAPWRTVHELLVNAALATDRVLRQPAPFVLQRSIDDFYVTYELNAYTDAPREVLNIYSDLHRNIQDKFNEAGVEICSPHFSALRDGNPIAIPEQYVKPGYSAPGFRINLTEAANNGAPRATP
jgi:small-conductance mechanosensitive channel